MWSTDTDPYIQWQHVNMSNSGIPVGYGIFLQNLGNELLPGFWANSASTLAIIAIQYLPRCEKCTRVYIHRSPVLIRTCIPYKDQRLLQEEFLGPSRGPRPAAPLVNISSDDSTNRRARKCLDCPGATFCEWCLSPRSGEAQLVLLQSKIPPIPCPPGLNPLRNPEIIRLPVPVPAYL